MAHFAKLDDNNIVIEVHLVNNNELLDENGNESEQKGVCFCKSLFGQDTNWKQTSYNGSFRKRFAGVGFTYNASLDAFVEPKPFSSWVFNELTCAWEAPVPYPNPDNGRRYGWDEESNTWKDLGEKLMTSVITL